MAITSRAHGMAVLAVVLLVGPGVSACDGRGGGPEGEGAVTSVAAEAEAVVAGMFAATNAHDADGVLSHFERSDAMVQIACTEVRRGYDRFAPIIRVWLEDRDDVAIEHTVIRVQALGPDAAVVAARGHNEQGLALHWTFVLHRGGDGDLRIVQEHQSWAGCREPRILHHGG